MKHSRILVTVLSIAVLVAMSGCGSSDKIQSVSMQVVGASGGTVDLYGLGGTLQLQVMANYSSGKQVDQTNYATYTAIPDLDGAGYCVAWNSNTCSLYQQMPTPPQGITVSKNGVITAVDPGICSWVDVGTSTTPAWAYSGYYQITATFRGFTSNPVYIPLSSAASGQAMAEGQCGPSQTTN